MTHSLKMRKIVNQIANDTGASYAAVCFVLKGLIQNRQAFRYISAHPAEMAQFTRAITTPKELLDLIHDKGASISGIAAELGRSHTLISQVINGLSTSEDVETYLSENLGRSRANLFPGVYAEKRKPGRQMSKGFNQ